jgi:hypothetical protein
MLSLYLGIGWPDSYASIIAVTIVAIVASVEAATVVIAVVVVVYSSYLQSEVDSQIWV